jgi:hypothetical protein
MAALGEANMLGYLLTGYTMALGSGAIIALVVFSGWPVAFLALAVCLFAAGVATATMGAVA